MSTYRKRRLIAVAIIAVCVYFSVINSYSAQKSLPESTEKISTSKVTTVAVEILGKLQIKGRSPKTGYTRDQFGASWAINMGCDTRNIILNRDLGTVKLNDECEVISGTLFDPYTGDTIQFVRGENTSGNVQIDHVVALSDAWQKGAQSWTKSERVVFANDPLELLAVDGSENQNKGDGDAATWLPPYKPFRCQYVARQIAIKYKYHLWLTLAEHDAMKNILSNCPNQLLPSP